MNAFDHIEDQTPAAPLTWGETAADYAKSAGAGVRLGLEGLAGLAGDLPQLGNLIVEKTRTKVLGLPENPHAYDEVDMSDVPYAFRGEVFRAPTSKMIHEATSEVVGESHEPKSEGGKYAKNIASFAPAALAGPGGVARNLVTQAVVPGALSEAAGQATEGTDAEPWARTLAALLGGVGAGAVGGRPIPRTAAQLEREALVNASERQGVHLPAAAMPDATGQARVAGKLGQVPFLGGPLRSSADRTVDQMGNRLDEISNAKGATNYQNTTTQTRDLLHHWQEHTAPATMTRAYDDVDAAINAMNPRGPRGGLINGPLRGTPLSNTMQTYREVAREMAGDTTISGRPAIALVEDAITRPGGLTYYELKRLRTDIGARGPKGTILPQPGTSMTAMDRLYGALTEDLRMAAFNNGGPPALRAWERANGIARDIKTRQGEIARIIGVKGQVSSEAIANRMLNLASDTKASGNLELLRTARRAVAEAGGGQAWDDVGAALIRRLGRDPSSERNVFSPDRFLTSMGKFGNAHADVLFGRGTMRDLRELQQIGEAHRALMRHGNPSGTGGVVALGQLATATGAAATATVATGSAAPLAFLTAALGGGMAVSAILARPASRRAMINWARARNGWAEARTPARLNALQQAAKEFAPLAAMESGRTPDSVERELIEGTGKEPPTGNVFDGL